MLMRLKSMAASRPDAATLSLAHDPAFPLRSVTRRHWFLGLAGVAALAVVLRVLRLGHGLPDVLDEDYPFRVALGMWHWDSGRVDWNPHFFVYPSLSIYLHLLIQKVAVAIGIGSGHYASAADYRLAFETDPTPMLLLARSFGVACDAATVVGVGVVGERLCRGAGIPAALLAALSAVLILTSRGIYCDSLLSALSVWALERMLAWRERGGAARFVTAVILVGLAAGAKYPGGLLVLPLAWVLVERYGRRGLLLAPAAAATSLIVFLITSPYVILDFATFRRHFGQQAEHMAFGHLGHLGGTSFGVHLATLVSNLGWVGLVALAGSLVLALRNWGQERVAKTGGAAGSAFSAGDARVLWAFALPLGAALGFAHTPMERYLSPFIAVGAALAAAVIVAAGRIAAETMEAAALLSRRLSFPTGLAVAALVLPPGFFGARAALSGGGNTQAEAGAWCRSHFASNDLLVQEQYGAPLHNRDQRAAVMRTQYFQAASPDAQKRYLNKPVYHALVLPLFVEGRAVVPVRGPSGAVTPVELLPFTSDFCRVYYDPRIFASVDYVITSGAVRGRFEADRNRFAAEAAFYDFLDRDAEPVAKFESRDLTTGPDIRIYHLGPRARRTLSAMGPLPPLWWAETMPMGYRKAADSVLAGHAEAGSGAVRDHDGHLSPWVRSLAAAYEGRVTAFTQGMASELGRLDRFEAAERFTRANLAVTPDDRESFRILVNCVFRRESIPRARATVESTLTALEHEDPRAAVLRETFDDMLQALDRTGLED